MTAQGRIENLRPLVFHPKSFKSYFEDGALVRESWRRLRLLKVSSAIALKAVAAGSGML